MPRSAGCSTSGITRAREHLELSFARSRNPGGRAARSARGSSTDCGRTIRARPRPGTARKGQARALLTGEHDVALFDALREWRLEVAQETDKPAYTVLTDATLAAIAEVRPSGMAELARVNGIGPAKIDKYGATILAIVSGAQGS